MAAFFDTDSLGPASAEPRTHNLFRFAGWCRLILIMMTNRMAWLRGMDLNHRPLGYERTCLWLCSS